MNTASQPNRLDQGAQPNGQGPYVGLLPYGFRPSGPLADTPLNAVLWPLGAPPNVQSGAISDLSVEDHICTFPGFWIYRTSRRRVRALFSLVIVEPKPIHGHHMLLARLFHRRFHLVLTCNPDLLAAIPNARRFIFGDSWVEDWRSRDLSKTAMLSLIASNKRRLKGHRLRHRVVREIRKRRLEADIMGRGYRSFDNKGDGLARYRYSVVIENSREPGYITEKIIDAFLTRTVPIYWGAPDIGNFFDLAGIIICTSLDDIMAAITGLTEADYEARQPAIDANRKTAALFANNARSMAKTLLQPPV